MLSIFESPARRLSLVRHIACSLLVATISVCMLPDANAVSIGFTSPSGITGTTIYEDQFGSGTVAAKFVAQDREYRFDSYRSTDFRLLNGPAGLTIPNGGVRSYRTGPGCTDFPWACVEIDLSWSSEADVATDTTVTVEANGWPFHNSHGPNAGLIPRDLNTWYNLGTFTIKPTIKELRVSTPTESSTVSEDAEDPSDFTVRLGAAPTANVTVNVSSR